MACISADKGYISRKNLQATVDVGAVPFIPFKSNTQPARGSDLWSKMFFFYNYKREEFLAQLSQTLERGNSVSDD